YVPTTPVTYTLSLHDALPISVDSMDHGKAVSDISVSSTEKTSAALKAILAMVESTSDLNTQIATATEEQSVVAEEISDNIQGIRSEEHTSELQSRENLVCRLL